LFDFVCAVGIPVSSRWQYRFWFITTGSISADSRAKCKTLCAKLQIQLVVFDASDLVELYGHSLIYHPCFESLALLKSRMKEEKVCSFDFIYMSCHQKFHCVPVLQSQKPAVEVSMSSLASARPHVPHAAAAAVPVVASVAPMQRMAASAPSWAAVASSGKRSTAAAAAAAAAARIHSELESSRSSAARGSAMASRAAPIVANLAAAMLWPTLGSDGDIESFRTRNSLQEQHLQKVSCAFER
jgi:hypothetical protein